MVRWGSVEIPELSWVPWGGLNPLPNYGLTHEQTGIRIHRDYGVSGQDDTPQYLLYLLGETEPVFRLFTNNYLSIEVQMWKHFAAEAGEDIRKLKRREQLPYMKRFRSEIGERLAVYRIDQENKDVSFDWSSERCAAFILMMFWILGGQIDNEAEPGPSKLDISGEGIPKEIEGVIRNPVWDERNGQRAAENKKEGAAQ